MYFPTLSSTALELSGLKLRSVRPAKKSDCTVNVAAPTWSVLGYFWLNRPATLGLGLCSQLLFISLSTLASLRGIVRVETVDWSGLPESYCTVTVCGSHVKRVLISDGGVGSLLRSYS